MQDIYHDDLRDFIRNGRLDAYELTDDELSRFLELWRWSAYTRRSSPTSADYDTHDTVNRLEKHLYHTFGVEVEYNTRLLLQQEIEAMMHLNILREIPRAVTYFLWRPLQLVDTMRNMQRARRVKPILGEQQLECRGYPREVLHRAKLPRTDILKRRYWRRLSQESPVERIEKNTWW